jgi:hypothetical protein
MWFIDKITFKIFLSQHSNHRHSHTVQQTYYCTTTQQPSKLTHISLCNKLIIAQQHNNHRNSHTFHCATNLLSHNNTTAIETHTHFTVQQTYYRTTQQPSKLTHISLCNKLIIAQQHKNHRNSRTLHRAKLIIAQHNNHRDSNTSLCNKLIIAQQHNNHRNSHTSLCNNEWSVCVSLDGCCVETGTILKVIT